MNIKIVITLKVPESRHNILLKTGQISLKSEFLGEIVTQLKSCPALSIYHHLDRFPNLITAKPAINLYGRLIFTISC